MAAAAVAKAMICRSQLEIKMAEIHPEWSTDKVRGGEIELRRPWQKIVFMAGLFGAVGLLLIAGLFLR
jgi:hypothetical protein